MLQVHAQIFIVDYCWIEIWNVGNDKVETEGGIIFSFFFYLI